MPLIGTGWANNGNCPVRRNGTLRSGEDPVNKKSRSGILNTGIAAAR